MKNRFTKLAALFLAATMTISSTAVSYASEVVTDEVQESAETTASTEDASDAEVTDAVISTANTLKAEVEDLKTLTAGEDYAEEEGFFLADSEEDAKKVAKEYGAELQSYSHGVAVLDFNRNVADALTETSDAHITSTVVEPNYIHHIYDINEEDLQAAVADAANTMTAKDSADVVTGDKAAVKDEEGSETANDPWLKSDSDYFQWFHDKINTLKAHEVATGKGVTVAVLDSGINTSSVDFDKAKITADYTKNYSSYKGVDQLYVDKKGNKKGGHGSNCSGVIGAIKNNGTMGLGVAPDVNIYSVQICNYKGEIYGSDEVEAMKMAIEKGVNVVSMSFGGPGYSAAMQELCNQAAENGITLVAAAGNDTSDSVSYPAGYNNVLSVAAINKDDGLSSFSNYGSWVDIAAPGGEVDYEARKYKDPICSIGAGPATEATMMSGTSQATPQVAAVAALVYSANDKFLTTKTIDTSRAVASILLETTNNQTYTYEDHSVTGLVQADAAVNAAKNYTGSSTYTIVDPSGDYGVYMYGKLAKGGSLKLAIGDATGNTKGVKGVTKSATWTSSDPAVTVKNGVVKCSKGAVAGTKGYVTATIGNETVSYAFTIAEKIQNFGPIRYRRNLRGYVFSYKSNYAVTASSSTYYDLTDPYALTGGRIFLTFNKTKNTIPGYYLASGGYKYDITIPKGQLKKCVVGSQTRNGDPRVVAFTKPGKYTVKYKLLDGSNKTFTLKIKVK